MKSHRTQRRVLAACVFVAALLAPVLLPQPAFGQAVKGSVAEEAGAPALAYHGLVPGRDTIAEVKKALGDPEFGSRWYSYKMYYPAEGRPGYYDVLHMHGNAPGAGLANIDAASVPGGYETEEAIREALGQPEYELRMATWKLLDYSEKGVRFALSSEGKTIGVAYVPHTFRRVPPGERSLMDLSHLRQGPQPRPSRPADLQGLRVGVAEVDITPQEESWLNHPFEVHDKLYARIAVFRNGETTAAFVGADLFGMGYPELMVIREAGREMGIDFHVLGMSHNHESGDTTGFYGFSPIDYHKHIQQRIIAGLRECLDNLQPVRELRTASRELPMDGIRVQHLFRNARSPGLLDPTISLVQAIGEDGRPLMTLVHYACHVESVQTGAREITADFPGYMCAQMKEDGLGQPIFLNGAVGGMVSGDNRARTHESARDMGLELAAIVKELAKTAQPAATFVFDGETRHLEIPLSNPAMIPVYERRGRPLYRGRVFTGMTYVRLGEAEFMTVPGELFPEVSFEILEKMQGFPRMIVGLGNDQMGYFVPPYDFRNDYYEESVSPGPAAATQVRDMALRILGAAK